MRVFHIYSNVVHPIQVTRTLLRGMPARALHSSNIARPRTGLEPARRDGAHVRIDEGMRRVDRGHLGQEQRPYEEAGCLQLHNSRLASLAHTDDAQVASLEQRLEFRV